MIETFPTPTLDRIQRLDQIVISHFGIFIFLYVNQAFLQVNGFRQDEFGLIYLQL